jgi:uncharacterized protein
LRQLGSVIEGRLLMNGVGVWLAGQRVATSAPLYAFGVLVGAIAGVSISLNWMSERATRAVLAAILFFAGLFLIVGEP